MNKVALIIGHNDRSRGAYSPILLSEFKYWKRIADKIKGVIPEIVDVYERKPNKAYIPEMNEVLKELNKNDYEFCLELHFNGSLNRDANGCECLVYWKNEKAKELATDFMARLQNVFGSNIRNKVNILKEKKIINEKETEVEKKEATKGIKGYFKGFEGSFTLAKPIDKPRYFKNNRPVAYTTITYRF